MHNWVVKHPTDTQQSKKNLGIVTSLRYNWLTKFIRRFCNTVRAGEEVNVDETALRDVINNALKKPEPPGELT